MARLSDADWMARFVGRVGSQRKAAEALGVSPSMVGLIVRGKRSGARYRDAARAGASGKPVAPPAPTPRTPRRVRRPVRQGTSGGGSRIMTSSPRLAAQEVRRTVAAGRAVAGFTVSLSAQRADRYRHKSDQGWVGSLTIKDMTDEQLATLQAGDTDGVLVALRRDHSWLGDARIFSITYTD